MRFKPTQLWWVLMPVLAAAGLYLVKFQVRAVHDEIAAMERDLARERAAVTVLSAEWSYLNRPQRLQSIVDAHLKTAFPKPVQLATTTDLPRVYALAVPPVTEDTMPTQLAALPGTPAPSQASAQGAYSQFQGGATAAAYHPTATAGAAPTTTFGGDE